MMGLRTLLTTSALALAMATSAAHAAPDRAELMKLHRGGTLKLNAHGSAGTIDPMINYELQFWQLLSLTNDGLLAFKKVDGLDGNTIVPDLAEALPKPQDDGKTYVFKLRDGIKFSTGQPVTPADVVASFERIFKVSSPTAGSFYNGIVGADECLKTPATCSLKDGVVADDKARTVTFHLTQADAEFFDKLSVPHASILPADTPTKDLGTQAAAATGPYMIQSYDPDHGMKIVRNPNFKEWSVDAQPDGYVDGMDYNFGLDDQAGLTAVENGQADWTFDDAAERPPAELGTKYAKQVQVHTLHGLLLHPDERRTWRRSTTIKARQARGLCGRPQGAGCAVRRPNLASPICQHLPVGMAGHEDYCPFTKDAGPERTGRPPTWSRPSS